MKRSKLEDKETDGGKRYNGDLENALVDKPDGHHKVEPQKPPTTEAEKQENRKNNNCLKL